MARCMKSEKQGHFVFYGAMVAEGVIALIWAAAGCAIYEVTGGLEHRIEVIFLLMDSPQQSMMYASRQWVLLVLHLP